MRVLHTPVENSQVFVPSDTERTEIGPFWSRCQPTQGRSDPASKPKDPAKVRQSTSRWTTRSRVARFVKRLRWASFWLFISDLYWIFSWSRHGIWRSTALIKPLMDPGPGTELERVPEKLKSACQLIHSSKELRDFTAITLGDFRQPLIRTACIKRASAIYRQQTAVPPETISANVLLGCRQTSRRISELCGAAILSVQTSPPRKRNRMTTGPFP